MLSDKERQARRSELMNKHKRKGGFDPSRGRLRSLYARCYINPVLDLFLFKPKKESK